MEKNWVYVMTEGKKYLSRENKINYLRKATVFVLKVCYKVILAINRMSPLEVFDRKNSNTA